MFKEKWQFKLDGEIISWKDLIDKSKEINPSLRKKPFMTTYDAKRTLEENGMVVEIIEEENGETEDESKKT